MCRVEHAFLHFIIIWLAILKCAENMNTESMYFSLFMTPKKNFIKFIFGNMTKTDRGIKLAEIS